MLRGFNISRSIRIYGARRAAAAAAATMAAAELELAACYDEQRNCKDGCGIRALRAIAEQSKASRALHIAQLRLSEALDGPNYATRALLHAAGVR